MNSVLSPFWAAALVPPLLAAAVVAIALRRWRLSGLALACGFALFAWLTDAFHFPARSAAEKIGVCALGAALIGLLLDLALRKPRGARAAVVLVSVSATIWVLWSVLRHASLVHALALGVGAALYTAWISAWTDALADQPARAGPAALWLGLGTGAANLFGGSALFGGLGFALGAAAAGYTLVQMVGTKAESCGRVFTWPAGLVAALLGTAGVLIAKASWQALLLLGVVPVIARLRLPATLPGPIRTILITAFTGVPAGVTIWLVRHGSGGVPI